MAYHYHQQSGKQLGFTWFLGTKHHGYQQLLMGTNMVTGYG